jgi:hypothetical protein
MRKSHPHRIDPANPQMNFVEAAAINHGESKYEALYGPCGAIGEDPPPAHYRKPHNTHGHSIGGRAGKLRLSGNPSAHRIGKRSK